MSELHDLLQDVELRPWAYEFFGLMRRVESLCSHLPRIGESLHPSQDPLRLGQAPALDFAPADLDGIERPAEPNEDGSAKPARLLVRFFGLLGSNGPMPLHVTEAAYNQKRHHKDTTLAHFLDLFHHRLLCLFYRAWAQAQPVVQMDRPEEDGFRRWLAACAGVPLGQGSLDDEQLLSEATWFTFKTGHPEKLVKVIESQFGVVARVEQYVGHWLAIDPEDHSRLGWARNRPGRSDRRVARLGCAGHIGTQVWDRQFRFRLHLIRLNLVQLHSLLPGGPNFERLVQWVQLLVGKSLVWDIQYELQPQACPQPALGSHAARLGITFRLGHRQDQRTPLALRVRPQGSFLARRPLPQGAFDG